jgi:transcription elongation factor SPT6
MENTGARRPDHSEANRKRHKRRDSGDSEEDRPILTDMFNDRTLSRSGRVDDLEEDDMDDFIEEDEDEEMDEETRATIRRQKKEAKRANARKVRSNAGVGQE